MFIWMRLAAVIVNVDLHGVYGVYGVYGLTTCAARVCGCVLQCLDFWLISVRKTVSFAP